MIISIHPNLCGFVLPISSLSFSFLDWHCPIHTSHFTTIRVPEPEPKLVFTFFVLLGRVSSSGTSSSYDIHSSSSFHFLFLLQVRVLRMISFLLLLLDQQHTRGRWNQTCNLLVENIYLNELSYTHVAYSSSPSSIASSSCSNIDFLLFFFLHLLLMFLCYQSWKICLIEATDCSHLAWLAFGDNNWSIINHCGPPPLKDHNRSSIHVAT